MKFKTTLFFTLLLILLISAVSASEINETQHGEEINIDEQKTVDIDDEITVDMDDAATTDVDDAAPVTFAINPSKTLGTFDELENKIYSAPKGSVVDLTKDYIKYSDRQIFLDKDITIDGHGHTLNANFKEGSHIFYSNTGNFILKNLILINGNNQFGGVIFIDGSGECIMENCTFYQNHAVNGGGAIYSRSRYADLTIINCTFKNNNAGREGGAISSDGTIYVYNSTFESNKAKNFGGAIAVNLKAFIYNSSFDSNSGLCGGALYCNYAFKFIVENTTFTRNTAEYSAGAVLSYGEGYFKQCLFDSNRANGDSFNTAYGGAIKIASTGYINNCTFINNYADDYGGAVYAFVLYITDKGTQSFFINNRVNDDNGGAIYALVVNVANTVFNENSAKVDGGAIYCEGESNICNCSFDSNRISGARSACYGGAVYSEKDATIDNCSFKNNYAENKGGAVYAASGLILKNDNIFDANTARDYGGAIYTSTVKSPVENIIFSNNKAETEDGGAIYINNENTVTFLNCSFVNNHCGDEGGAIYLDSRKSHITIKDNYFSGNTADDEGQTVYNCGYYDLITSNKWSGTTPSSDNDQLVEWKVWSWSNAHHVDSHAIIL